MLIGWYIPEDVMTSSAMFTKSDGKEEMSGRREKNLKTTICPLKYFAEKKTKLNVMAAYPGRRLDPKRVAICIMTYYRNKRRKVSMEATEMWVVKYSYNRTLRYFLIWLM